MATEFGSGNEGKGLDKYTDSYSMFLHDNNEDRQWNQMTTKERQASIVSNNLVWSGPLTTAAAPGYLEFELKLATDIIGVDPFGFKIGILGEIPSAANFTGNVVLVNDGVGNINDACEPLTAMSAAQVAGNIALADFSGNCVSSALGAHVVQAGATGLIINDIFDNPGAFNGALPPPPPNEDFATVVLSSVDGNTIKAELPVAVTIVSGTIRAGLDENGLVKIFAPTSLSPSAIAHYDTSLNPTPIMGTGGGAFDPLTVATMHDMGWDGQLHCPVNSEANGANGVADESLIAPTVVVDGCDTGVPNQFGPFQIISGPKQVGGCTINDMIAACVKRDKKGELTSCMNLLRTGLVTDGIITDAQGDDIKACQ